VNEWLLLSDDVRGARERNAAVVALETAIVSHGLPYPDNLTTARELEAILHGLGVSPATIGVLNGRIRVGLTDAELRRFACPEGMLKLGSADLAYAVAAGRDGATTVAATTVCASLAGIEVVATGGIGGVHIGAETTLDVSGDLTQLGRTPVAVVCSGAKGILDIERTLEVLETLGVSVVCYRADEFPAFWSRSSGFPAPVRSDSVEEIAHLIRVKRALGLRGGVVIANPVPGDSEIPRREIVAHVERAMRDARERGIVGKALTPFLLSRIADSTGGRSLTANVALVKANARLAGLLSLALAEAAS
jgi:pseudouridine-5'-phosphate glycosidase